MNLVCFAYQQKKFNREIFLREHNLYWGTLSVFDIMHQ